MGRFGWMLLMLAACAGLAMAQGRVEARRPAGLRSAVFKQASGEVRVQLPDDLAAGDTISGTVVASDPASDELVGCVVDVEERRVPVKEGRFSLRVPPMGGVRVTLWDASGAKAGEVLVPGQPCEPVADKGAFQVFPLAQAGGEVQVYGSFDGDLATTEVTVQGRRVTPLAESPRKTVLRVPTQAPRESQLRVREGGRWFETTLQVVGPERERPQNPLEGPSQADAPPPFQMPGGGTPPPTK